MVLQQRMHGYLGVYVFWESCRFPEWSITIIVAVRLVGWLVLWWNCGQSTCRLACVLWLTWVVITLCGNFAPFSIFTARLSVHLSVTRWHCVKTTQATIMGFSLADSPMTLVSSGLTSPQNSKRNMGSEGAKW